ncbi:ATP-binding protein [Streptomyces avermitilis]|uniref:ATP-binding protein n=1 Tax=Streptomyces avermitilis TaxID=33903 RepID=UPI0037F75A8F
MALPTTPCNLPLRTSMPGGRDAVVAVPAQLEWVPVARHFAVAILLRWGLSGDNLDTAEIIVGELASNAARYGRRDLTLRLVLVRRTLRIAVVDSGPPRTSRWRHIMPRPPTSTAEASPS